MSSGTLLKRCRAAAFLPVAGALAFGLGLGGCDSGPQSVATGSQQVTLEVGTQGDSMVFDRSELRAPAGAVITVIFYNRSRLLTMDHNWVLTRPGSEESVVQAGLAAGSGKDFVAPNDPNVIAATKLAPRGESRSVTFPAPPPGIYPYLCAFPGHQMVMKGTLIVTRSTGAAPANAAHQPLSGARVAFPLKCNRMTSDLFEIPHEERQRPETML